jgi:hypothetical protein
VTSPRLPCNGGYGCRAGQLLPSTVYEYVHEPPDGVGIVKYKCDMFGARGKERAAVWQLCVCSAGHVTRTGPVQAVGDSAGGLKQD